jgi:hypothetical protein
MAGANHNDIVSFRVAEHRRARKIVGDGPGSSL